jgi:hypothetical protein
MIEFVKRIQPYLKVEKRHKFDTVNIVHVRDNVAPTGSGDDSGLITSPH